MSNYDKNQIVELSDQAMEAVAGGGKTVMQNAEADAASVVIGSNFVQSQATAIASNISEAAVEAEIDVLQSFK